MRTTLTLLCLATVQAYKDKNCVDISRYAELTFNESAQEICNYKFQTQCLKRSQEVCQDVPVHQCEVVAYTECEDQQTTVKARDDSLDISDFYPINCRPNSVPQILTEVKMMPVCQNITKKHCDTKWVLNAAGEKVWAGNENCKDVTWEDCSLQPRNVTTEVETFDCAEATEAILYQTVAHHKVEVALFSKTCRAVAVPVCSVTTARQCRTVEWEDCQDILLPNCFKSLFRVPYQEYSHLLRCTVAH